VAAVREQALFSFTTLWWQLEGGKTEPKIASEPISEWFARCLVLDFPEYVSMVSSESLRTWDSSFYLLYEIGLARLRDCTTPKFEKQPGFYIGGWHDDYDNSRILIPEVFSPLHLDGDPVVCLPNRNSLLKDGEVADFSVAENSLIFNDVERAKKVSELFYYQQQTGSLVKLYQEKGKDLFVANYTLNRLETGGYESMCVWSKTIPTLLARTDFIAFYDPTRPEFRRTLGRAKWDDVMRIAGDLFLDTQMFPARFYVSKFPTDEELAAAVLDQRR
jgi:hypothetical protein